MSPEPRRLLSFPRPRVLDRLSNLQHIVARGPTREVGRIGHEDPPEGFPVEPIWREVKALYRSGLHPAIALHVRHQGRVVLDRTLGHLHNKPGPANVPGPVATPDTLFNLFSASKIVTATLVHALVEDGLLNLDRPVSYWLPAFARHGKHTILLRHLLQHTAGIPDMPRMTDIAATLSAGRMDMELLYDLRPLSRPGERVAYHSLTAWFLVQEIIETVTGHNLRDVLRTRLLAPLGVKHLNYGVTPDLLDQVARHAVTGLQTPGIMSRIFDRNIGLPFEQAIEMTNDPGFLTAILPSANVIAPPHEVGRFMQMLLDGGRAGDAQILRRDTVQRMITDTTRLQLDGTFGFPLRYGLGVMMGGDRFSLFGLGTGGAFGHLGLSTVVVFADPRRDLVVVFLNTGKPMFAPGMIRWYGVLQHIASRVPRRKVA